MIINKDLCKKCGKCVPECGNRAISKNDAGEYAIDQSLCTDCSDCTDIECVRYCKFNAITKKDGSPVEFDPTARILSGHIPWMLAMMGSRGKTGRFPIEHREYQEFRKLIASAFTNPDLEIRVVYGWDDICGGCQNKTKCKEGPGGPHFERLGVKPGEVIRFWDLIQLVEDKYSLQFIKRQQPDHIDDEFLGCIRTFVSPDAKMLTNDE